MKNMCKDNCKFNAKMIKKKYVHLCDIENILCKIIKVLSSHITALIEFSDEATQLGYVSDTIKDNLNKQTANTIDLLQLLLNTSDEHSCGLDTKIIKSFSETIKYYYKINCALIENILIIMDGISANTINHTITIGTQTFIIANACNFCDPPPVDEDDCITCPIDFEPFISGIDNEINNINNIMKRLAIIKCDVIKHQNLLKKHVTEFNLCCSCIFKTKSCNTCN